MLLFLSLSSVPVHSNETRRLFDQGMEAFRKGNFGSAELLFRKVLDGDSDEYRDRAWFHLARSMHARKNYRSALFEFNSFLNRCRTESLAVESRFWMGECHYHLGNYHSAMEEYRRYILKNPDGTVAARAHERMGDIYYDQKRNDEAVLEWDAAITKEGELQGNRSLRYRTARALYESGRYDDALRRLSLDGTVVADRDDARMMMLSGMIHQKRGDDRNAIKSFNAIPVEMKNEPIFRDTGFYEAKSHMRIGEKSAAEGHLREYLRHGEGSHLFHEALCELGILLIDGDRGTEGIELLGKVRASSAVQKETRTRAVMHLGLFYLDLQPEKAIPYLEESLADDAQEQRSILLLALGRAYMLAGRLDDAIGTFLRILHEGPFAQERDDAAFFLGNAYLEKGDFEHSIQTFETIRREQPFSRHYAESRYYLALALSRKGDLDAAILLVDEHLGEKSPAKEYESKLLLLRLLVAKNDLVRAGRIAESLMRTHAKDQGLDVALLDYAATLLREGFPSKKLFDALISRFGDTENAAELKFMVANDHFRRERYARALVLYDAYLATPYTAHRGDALLGKVRSLYRLGRHDEVAAESPGSHLPVMDSKIRGELQLLRMRSLYRIKQYREAYEIIDPARLEDYTLDDVRIYLECATRVGDHRSALKALRLIEGDRELFSESLYMMGRYYLAGDDLKEAERFLKRVVDECPGSGHEGHALLSLGEVRLLRGDPQGALAIIAGVESPSGGEILSMKNALLIRCYFPLGMVNEALVLTEKSRTGLLACACGEPVMNLVLDHYYRKKNLQQFNRYATFLARYDGNEEVIGYLSGKLNFETGNYAVAYRHFKELSMSGGRYRHEARYCMGLHELHVLGDGRAAGETFAGLISDSDTPGAVRLKALLDMAMIYRERGDDMKARECLITIIRMTGRGTEHAQAMNLIELFGYEGP